MKNPSHSSNQDCKVFARHEEWLAVPGLDAVCICTPAHWHARIGIDAANAGKDIYGEKPFAWGLAEGRALAAAVNTNKRTYDGYPPRAEVGSRRREDHR